MAARFINLSVGSNEGASEFKTVVLQQTNGRLIPVGNAIGKEEHDICLPSVFGGPSQFGKIPRDVFDVGKHAAVIRTAAEERAHPVGNVADIRTFGNGLLQKSNGFQRADEKMKEMFG